MIYSVISERFDALYIDYSNILKDGFVEYLYKELFSKTERDIPMWGNEYNCDECPENKDFDDWEGKYPCGQQNCWVTCHCREIME